MIRDAGGRVAVVTGGAASIGAACAQLAQTTCAVIVSAPGPGIGPSTVVRVSPLVGSPQHEHGSFADDVRRATGARSGRAGATANGANRLSEKSRSTKRAHKAAMRARRAAG